MFVILLASLVVGAHAYIYTHMHSCIIRSACIHIHRHKHHAAHMHTYIHAYMHTYIHTHTQGVDSDTYTSSTDKHRGLIPRVFDHMFDCIQELKKDNVDVSAHTYMYVYIHVFDHLFDRIQELKRTT
jgi:hypothetical protein